MKDSIIIKEDFCDQVDLVRASALQAGFGVLKPESTEMGKDTYEGMGFLGRHDLMVKSLVQAIGRPVFPGAMFFRSTRPGMEKAYVHSDRMHGDWTCIVYLSDHPEIESGTAFFRHRRTGWREMPSPEVLKQAGVLKMMDECMQKGDPKDWEQIDFIRGLYNRALIFHAPLFHARRPEDGLGDGSNDRARLTWVCHFSIPQ